MAPPIAFILGFGKGVGASVAARFKLEGFNVAVASRTLSPEKVEREFGYFGVQVDLSKTSDLDSAYRALQDKFGSNPNAVVYNASSFTPAPGGAKDPFSLDFGSFQYDVSVGGVHVYQAAQLAFNGFKVLPEDTPKAFIATGNPSPWETTPKPGSLGLSTAKRVSYSIIESAAFAYNGTGNRFYYATQVNKKGGGVYPPDPDSHAKVFWELYKRKEQGPWDVRFVKGGDPWISA